MLDPAEVLPICLDFHLVAVGAEREQTMLICPKHLDVVVSQAFQNIRVRVMELVQVTV